MERPTCATCSYWEVVTEPDDTTEASSSYGEGFCCRHPPAILVAPPARGWAETTYFPETFGHQGCGEHPDFPAYLLRLREAERYRAAGNPDRPDPMKTTDIERLR